MKVMSLKELAKSEGLSSEFASDPDMMDVSLSSSEIMESLDEHILALEADPNVKEVIEEIFRGAHVYEGAVYTGDVQLQAMAFMHRMENYLKSNTKRIN